MQNFKLIAYPDTIFQPSGSRDEQAVIAADQIGDYQASVLARIIANAHNVTVRELFHHSRSRAPIAATRQLAMYMMHVVLGRSLTEVGKFYSRDRTTVSYACMRMEDMRDNETFDIQVTELEQQYNQAISTGNFLDNAPFGGKAND